MAQNVSRDEWKAKLLKAGLPEDVVAEFLKGVDDADLVRMKDLTENELAVIAQTAVNKAAQGDMPDEDEEDEEEEKKGKEKAEDDKDKKGASCKDGDEEPQAGSDTLKDLMAFADYIVQQTVEKLQAGTAKDMQYEIEVPELAALVAEVTALKESVSGLQAQYAETLGVLKELTMDDAQRMKEQIAGMSQASKARVRQFFQSSAQDALDRVAQFKEQQGQATTTEQQGGDPTQAGTIHMKDGEPVFVDGEGNKYRTFGEFLAVTSGMAEE